MAVWTENKDLSDLEILETYTMTDETATDIYNEASEDVIPTSGVHSSMRGKTYNELTIKNLLYLCCDCNASTSDTRMVAMAVMLHKTIDGSDVDVKFFVGATKRLSFEKLRGLFRQGLARRYEYLEKEVDAVEAPIDTVEVTDEVIVAEVPEEITEEVVYCDGCGEPLTSSDILKHSCNQ